MALMPGKRKPKAVSKSAADFYRQRAKKFWEYPSTLSAEKAREAVRHGMETEAGVRLTWQSGRPVAGEELEGMPFVPKPEQQVLERLHTGGLGLPWTHGFWNKVRELRRPHPGTGALVGWEPLLQAVNRITGSGYTLEEFKALVEGSPPEGELPVHEKRMIGPVDVTSMHRSPHIVFGSRAPHQWIGDPHFREVGFGHDPFVIVCLYAKPGDVNSLIPQARQKAIGYADVQGWSLGFTPTLSIGRIRMFQDQQGKRRRGKRVEVMFPLVSKPPWPRPRNVYC